ncbi:MAG: hypothetical protein IJO92_03605 [Clostridia bacterium]|nr:hypothetical protein [Clostridia bacterium]
MWLFAVIAMLCWSGSDIFSKIGSPQTEKTSHYKVGIAVGGIMGLHALYMIFIEKIPFSLMDIVHYLPASFFYIVSMVVGYVGLRYIELSISSPICNGSGAVSALLCMLVFGVTFNPEFDGNAIYLNGWIIAGLVLVIGGILFLGIVDSTEDPELRALRQQKANRKYTKSLWAILLPVLYCVLDSLGTFVDTLIAEGYVERIGNEDLAGDVMNTAYELTWMIIAIAFAIYVFGIKKEKINKKFDGVKLLGSTCETVGQIFYAKVVVSGYIPGLVIISSYCLVSMVWSAIFLKEKLSWKHYLCLAAAILGILVLGYFDV